MALNPSAEKKPLTVWSEICKLSKYLKHILFFSLFTNLLLLAPTWYMLEVYDRVVLSKNHQTLLMLTILVLVMYVILEIIDWVRSGIMMEMSDLFADALKQKVFNNIFQAKLKQVQGGTVQPLNDLSTIKTALNSAAIKGLIDAPYAIITLLFIFLINRTMGYAAVIGAIALIIIAWVNQKNVQPPLADANRHAIQAQNYANNAISNAQVIEAMGMLDPIHQRWQKKQHQFLSLQALASDRAGVNSALSKLIQTMQGSVLLGLGCWLTLEGIMENGGSMMIVGSILGGRVLAPIVAIITQWQTIASARDAIKRLDEFLVQFPEPQESMPLPEPQGNLSVEAAMVFAPNTQQSILRGVTFRLPAGAALAVIGPSASGKTSLARLLTGIWPTVSGKVRLDGADVYTWNKQELGPHVGYLPQNVELFDGTLAENIARFGVVDMAKVKLAASIVGLDELVAQLPQQYDTPIGDEGAFLSGGQRQRVALARAIYGNPKFVILDEPNSSLDEQGELALNQTLNYLKSQKTTLVVISHRSQILSLMDYVLLLVDGAVTAFGPRDEVLKQLAQANQKAAEKAIPQEAKA